MSDNEQIKNNEKFDTCPSCKSKIPQGAIACSHCKAHQIIQFNTLGKILQFSKKLNIIAVIAFLLYLFCVYNNTSVKIGFLELAIVCFIPQILLWVLPKDKYTEKVWIND